jgi:hypothetical protein
MRLSNTRSTCIREGLHVPKCNISRVTKTCTIVYSISILLHCPPQEVIGAVWPGNVVRIGSQCVRVACAFDKQSACCLSVRDMVKLSFPKVAVELESQYSTVILLFIGSNIRKVTAKSEAMDLSFTSENLWTCSPQVYFKYHLTHNMKLHLSCLPLKAWTTELPMLVTSDIVLQTHNSMKLLCHSSNIKVCQLQTLVLHSAAFTDF